MDNKYKIEALLFGAARYISVDELMRHTALSEEKINEYLKELQQKYESGETSISLVQQANTWKLTVKDEFLPLMRKVVKLTEMDKPLMETLAIIAWKYPSLQHNIIKIRHNKAYEHLDRLEAMGFITRSKYGRTRKITLTPKFFEYFDLPSREQAQQAFQEILPKEVKENLEKVEREIEDSEKLIDEAKKIEKEQEEQEKQEEKDGEKTPREYVDISKLDEEYEKSQEQEDNSNDEDTTN